MVSSFIKFSLIFASGFIFANVGAFGIVGALLGLPIIFILSAVALPIVNKLQGYFKQATSLVVASGSLMVLMSLDHGLHLFSVGMLFHSPGLLLWCLLTPVAVSKIFKEEGK
jgi:hypothetical protein